MLAYVPELPFYCTVFVDVKQSTLRFILFKKGTVHINKHENLDAPCKCAIQANFHL
uniref:Uncharacterized protein n=1 Tax=Anguilla anguilla TaxID=7936 RepID=A0A0E9XS09_ANGAN